MHSFHPSRGRVLFEFVCALGIVASSVGAWKQTGASALLVAAFVAGLYGFVHLFDLRRRGSTEAFEPQRIEFEPEVQVELAAHEGFRVRAAATGPEPASDLQPISDRRSSNDDQNVSEEIVEGVQLAEPAAAKASGRRRAKTPKKGSSRRANPAKEARGAEPIPTDAVEVVAIPSPEETVAFEPDAADEMAHTPVAPLFEPAPYVHVRQQRAAFGRKAR